jgi:hypothetical protein
MNFRCLSSNTCIPYLVHCSANHRCPNQPAEGTPPIDARCFDGQFFRDTRCDTFPHCPFSEDEFVCDYQSLAEKTSLPYREVKESRTRSAMHTVQLTRYPSDANITPLTHQSTSSGCSPRNIVVVALLVQSWSRDVCLCETNFTGENCSEQDARCLNGYCAFGSLEEMIRLSVCVHRVDTVIDVRLNTMVVSPILV